MREFFRRTRARDCARFAAAAVLVLAVAAPAAAQTALGRAIEVLGKRGVYAEDSLYACLLDAYYQGISIAQATEDCATKLLEDDGKGIDGGPFGPLDPRVESFFDPYKITAACNAGNADVAAGGQVTVPGGWGEFSWGSGENRMGLPFEASAAFKAYFILEAKEAAEKEASANLNVKAAAANFIAACSTYDDYLIGQAAAAENAAKIEAKKAKEAKEAAEKKAKEDPNKVDPKKKHTTGDETPCEEALDAAREILRECQRTRWQSSECQQLEAGVKGCPDPVLIHVDPEQGYACGLKPDPQALKEAWVAQCEELQRGVDPDTSPCKQPEIDDPGRYIKNNPWLLCDDPAADYEPGSEACTATLVVDRPFGEPDVHQIAVWGLNKLGGPIVVITDRSTPPPPSNGPDPRPGPKDP